MASLPETVRHRLSCGSEHHRNPNAEDILQTSPLRKDQANRILVFSGAFNPPHTSHLQVLQHALESNPDLNIVAAIIRPKGDDYLAEKNVSTGRSLILTTEQRAELCCKDARLPACAWACDSPTIADQLEKDLVQEAAKKGLEIRLVSLVGPDSWKAAKPPVRDTWFGNEFLISDAGRAAIWYSGGSLPRHATGYTAWKKAYPTRMERNEVQAKNATAKWNTRYAREILKIAPCFVNTVAAKCSPFKSQRSLESSQPGNVSSSSYDPEKTTLVSSTRDFDANTNDQDSTTTAKHEEVYWECHLEHDPEIKARFVSKRPCLTTRSCTTCSAGSDISSTSISQIIATTTGDTRREKLRDIVLSPDLLFEYLESAEAEIRNEDIEKNRVGLWWGQ